MKRIFLLSVIALLSLLTVNAENNLLPVMPMVSSGLDLPSNALRSLKNKVTTMAVESGFGALSSPIVLTASVNVLDKTVTTTAPPMYAMEVEVFFYVADVDAGVILAEKSVIVKGADRSEARVLASAINRVNPRTPEMRQFTARARERVIEYYSQRVPVLLKKARMYAERKEYAHALLVLSDIPEGVEQWNEAVALSSEIYLQMVDLEASELLHKADVALARNDYASALNYVSGISPQSSKVAEAKKMVADIKAENDYIASLREQIEALTAEKEALETDNARAQQEIRTYTAEQQEIIEQNNASVEEKLTGWLLGKMGNTKSI